MKDVFDVELMRDLMDRLYTAEIRKIPHAEWLRHLNVVGRFLFQLEANREMIISEMGKDAFEEVETWVNRLFEICGNAVERTKDGGQTE